MERFISNFNHDLTDALFPKAEGGRPARPLAGRTSPAAEELAQSLPAAANGTPLSDAAADLAPSPPPDIPVPPRGASDSVFRDKGSGTERVIEGEPTPVPPPGREPLANGGGTDAARPEESGKGYLIVRATAARSALPIARAEVTVTAQEEGGAASLIASLPTDESGKTAPIALSAPPISASEQPGEIRPFSVYNVRVKAPGYYTVELSGVPIFPDRTAIQTVNMVPLLQGTDSVREENFGNAEPLYRAKEE